MMTMNPFLRVEFRSVTDDWDTPDIPLTAAAHETITAAARYLAARFPVTTTSVGYPDTIPVAVLLPWLTLAVGRTLKGIEIDVAFALAGFTLTDDADTLSVDILLPLVVAEIARASGSDVPFDESESRWLPAPRVTRESVAEVLRDLPTLTVGGEMNLSPDRVARSRAELTSVSLGRIQLIADKLVETFPAVVEITEDDAARDHHVASWLTMRHPELGHIQVGELVIAAALAGYQVAVEPSGAVTHDDLYVGIPALFIDLHRTAEVTSPSARHHAAAAA